jgi:hypothetical protein
MTHDDDQAWLDALAGRARSDSAATREAGILRNERLALAVASEDHVVPEPPASREAALIARARQEGLIPDKASAARWARPWSLAVAAAVAGFAVALTLFMHSGIEADLVRASPDGVVRLEASDPVALKLQLIEELRAVGVAATGYEVLGRQGIDADLPQPLTKEVRHALEKHGIPAPTDGVLRVEIVNKDDP